MTSIDSAKRAHPEDGSFQKRKARLMAERSARGGMFLDDLEEKFDRSVLQPAIANARIDPAKSFLEHKRDYDESVLLQVLQRMPKGAVLHTHGLATGDLSVLVERIQKDGHFFVWQGGDPILEGSFRFFPSDVPPGDGWIAARECAKEQLYAYITHPVGLPSVEACWEEFANLWIRIAGVNQCAPLFFGRDGFLWTILICQNKSRVRYLEIKEVISNTWIEHDGKELTDEEWVGRFRDTVDQFCAEYKDFIGARLVLTCLKFQTEESVRNDFRRAVKLKQLFPDYVAGFDLAGGEDICSPIESYATMLEEEVATAKSCNVDLPLLLHAGETNVPTATQIFDAVVLGCERIGHGFALSRHPTLIKEVIGAEMSLECCPISNQVLGYYPNLACHAGLNLLRSGVPLTISPDDPGMWHYSDVSYDFAAVAKAWNLSLLELKTLARNSLVYSTLRGDQKVKALEAWEQEWHAWVKDELQTNSN